MLGPVTFDQMLSGVSCETTLPQIPMAAMRLSQLVDEELISQDVLKVAASDPSLTAGLLRSASSPLYALSPKPVTDVRTALSILGVRGAKSVAMSVMMQAIVGNAFRSGLDTQKFVQHSTFVGIMAKYVFLRRKQLTPFETEVNGDEVFAAGVLHELGLGLIAVTYPDIFSDMNREANAKRVPFDTVFLEWYKEPITRLTVAAFETWKLPSVFASLVSCMHAPDEHESEPVACASLAYSDWIAHVAGFSERETAPYYEPCESIRLHAALPAEELAGAVQQVIAHTESCCPVGQAA